MESSLNLPIPELTLEEQEFFWTRVQETDDCWLWVGNINDTGYGRLEIRNQLYRANRISYRLAYGPFDWTLQVLHKCDNPVCVRPDHLFLGTDEDNQKDAVSKGRHMFQNYSHHRRRGVEQHLARINDDIVRKIRKDPDPQRRVAEKYGIHQAQVWRIKNRKAWAHVED